MPQWKEHRPSILRPKFAKNLVLGFLFCFVLFCLNQTTTSFTIFTRSNYSVPKHQTCTAHGVRVSTLIDSPSLRYSGTCTISPVSSVAGLVRAVAEAPLIAGSHCTIL